ncbi:MAG: glycosyltransferase family 4 protein [Sporolactobacillus sp.]
MKIAFIATEKLPVPAIRGGAIQIYLESVAALLAESNHQITVYSIKDAGLADNETRKGIHYIHLSAKHYLQELIHALQSAKYDLIHLCNRPEWVTALADAAPESKFVLSVHNEMFAEGKITDKEGHACIERLSQIVTVSHYIGTTITRRFPEAEPITKTVYSGVSLEKYHPSWTAEGRSIREHMREELGLRDRKVALFVGRLSKVKGPHILLQALPSIIREHPEAMLVFVGSKWFGDDQVNNYVRHLYTLGALNPENVGFIKFVKPEDIPGFYSMADLFVCSSQWQEPLARVHYEAMAAGLPILTTNRGGNAEVIERGENGYVLDHFDDPEAYADIINQLFSDEDKSRRMGKKGREIAEHKYGWQRVADELLEVYEFAADGNK